MIVEQVKKDGFSLRTLHLCLVICAVILSVVMIYSTYHLSTGSSRLAKISEQQIELREAARELLDASDYLTESVQCYTIYGEMRFLNNYFKEAFENNRRENALKTMSSKTGVNEALYYLQSAMDVSLRLMEREYYAMRLVIEAMGYTAYPELLKSVELSAEDLALSKEEKLRHAVDLVHNDAYSYEKDLIRNSIRNSLDSLAKMAYKGDADELSSLTDGLNIVRIITLLQTLGIFFMVWLTSRLGIHPVLNAVERIKEDSPIPEIGANEFRYLARTYNKMYEVYQKSLEQLNFKASHDDLTEAYNRSGYELLLSSLDLNTTYFIMIDVDDFKTINDTYGHDIGDKVLVKVVKTIKNNFRSDDYICRLGGDEFVVLAVHSTSMQRRLIETKIERINTEMANTDDGLPAISISAGIVHGEPDSNFDSLMREADEALYETKRNGKHGYSFYYKSSAVSK